MITLRPTLAMKHASLLLAALSTATLHAQWTTPDQNTLVRAASEYQSIGGPVLTSAGPDGSTYVSWYDTFAYNMRIQRLDADGIKLWGDAGVLVSDQPQLTYVTRYDLHADNAGNVIVAFADARDDGQLDVVAYALDPQGTQLWGPDGIELRIPDAHGIGPVVGPLADGRVAIAYATDRVPSTIAYQVFSAAGDPLWAQPREWVSDSAQTNANIVPCADGGFWLQCSRTASQGFPPLVNFMAQRFGSDGEMLGPEVRLSIEQNFIYYFTKPISDGHNGLYMALTLFNPDNENQFCLALQRVRANGTTWDPLGVRTESGALFQQLGQGALPVLVNDDSGVMMGYERSDAAQSQGGIYVQRWDTAGTRMLGDGGVEVVPFSGDAWESDGNAVTNDGVIVLYKNGYPFAQDRLYAARVDMDGNMVWSPARQDIASTPSEKGFACITPSAVGQAVVAWTDWRSGVNGVFAQNIPADGLHVGIDEVSAWNGAHLIGDPGDRPELVLDQGMGAFTYSIHAADGRLVDRRSLPRGYAGQRIAVSPRDLPAGLYKVVLQANTGERQVLTWVKP